MDKLQELQKEANKFLKSQDNENSLNAFKKVIDFESMRFLDFRWHDETNPLVKPNDDVNKIKEDAILAICAIYQSQGYAVLFFEEIDSI